MTLRVIDDGIFRDITIGEGEMFLLPGKFTAATKSMAELIAPQLTHHTTLSGFLIQSA